MTEKIIRWQEGDPKPVVEIEVVGGVAYVVKCPDWIEVEIRDYDVEDEEEDEDWYFTMDGMDVEEFGPYSTEEDALGGINQIRKKAKELNDGVERTFTAPYQGKRDSVWND